MLSFPWIAELQIVRAWAALRVMPPDGLPIYDQSERFPGAFTANCHSGVTLAGAHANLFAPMVAAGALDPMLDAVLRQALRCSGRGLTRPGDRRRSWSRAAPCWCRRAPRPPPRCCWPACRSIRDTPVRGSERAPYCMMGVCFDCLAEIDGVPNRQSCMVPVPPGMRIRRQRGRRIVSNGSAGVPPASR